MLGTITADWAHAMRTISQPSRCLASTNHLRWLVVFSSALLLGACDSRGDRLPMSPSIPTSPTFTPPGASNPNELVGSVYRIENDRVFHVRGQRVEIPRMLQCPALSSRGPTLESGAPRAVPCSMPPRSSCWATDLHSARRADRGDRYRFAYRAPARSRATRE